MMKLTPTEREIFEHRFEVPDCLADALTDHDDADMTPEEFQEAYESIDINDLPDNPTPHQLAIIVDCLVGSTFMQAVDCEHDESPATMNTGKWMSYHKAAASLEAKIAKLAGRNVALTMH